MVGYSLISSSGQSNFSYKGDNVMASSYLELAQHFGGESIEEIQNTVIAKANQARNNNGYSIKH